jgi:hypothetical protein
MYIYSGEPTGNPSDPKIDGPVLLNVKMVCPAEVTFENVSVTGDFSVAASMGVTTILVPAGVFCADGVTTVVWPTYTWDNGYPMLPRVVTLKEANWSVASMTAGPPPEPLKVLLLESTVRPLVHEATAAPLTWHVSYS